MWRHFLITVYQDFLYRSSHDSIWTLATFSIYFEQNDYSTTLIFFFLIKTILWSLNVQLKRMKRSHSSNKCLFFFVLFWFSKLRKVRVIHLLLGLLLWTSNPHFKHITKSGSDKRHWREQQNSSTLLWLDCTDYRTGMNKRQWCSWEGGFPIWMCAGASALLTL